MNEPRAHPDTGTSEFFPVEDGERRLALLGDLHRQRAPLRITLEDGRAFHSFLLQVHPHHLILDQLTPPPEEGRLARHTRLICFGKTDGVAVRFSTCVRARGERDGEVLYKLDFPTRMERRQRRRFYRVAVPMERGFHAELTLPEGELEGELADLSAEGLGIRLQGPPPPWLNPGVDGVAARLHLDGRVITCLLEVRNLRQCGPRRWLLGCRISELPAGQRHHLERTVAALDRDQRRRR